MNSCLVERIVHAVLYEGYILYPYRPSVKNQQRWTFGGLYPEAFCKGGSDPSSNQTQCLVNGNREATLDISVRFLHLTDRTVGELTSSLRAWREDAEPPFQTVESLRVGEKTFHGWQEAEERRVDLPDVRIATILDQTRQQRFRFSSRRWLEPLSAANSELVGVLIRQQYAVDGAVEVAAKEIDKDLYRVTIKVINETAAPAETDRDSALLRSLASTHTVLQVHDAEFVSLLDPPKKWCKSVEGCRNVGSWPVLVGEDGARDTMLSSPIILYDYPQIAPESPGDLFDGTEIDEILTLRILTLTDEEKQMAAALDERGRALLTRSSGLTREQLYGLHGTLRAVSPVSGDPA